LPGNFKLAGRPSAAICETAVTDPIDSCVLPFKRPEKALADVGGRSRQLFQGFKMEPDTTQPGLAFRPIAVWAVSDHRLIREMDRQC
jgi:hypothetical protein